MTSQGKNGFIAQCMNKVKCLQGKGFSLSIWTSSNQKKESSFTHVKSAPADLCCVPVVDPAQLVRSLKKDIIRLVDLEKKNRNSVPGCGEETGCQIVQGMMAQVKELEVQFQRQFCQNREKLRRQCLILALIKGVRAALADEYRRGNWIEKRCSGRSRIMTAICCIEHELSKSTQQAEQELSNVHPAITPSCPSLGSSSSPRSVSSKSTESSTECPNINDCCTPAPVTDFKACISSDESTVSTICEKLSTRHSEDTKSVRSIEPVTDECFDLCKDEKEIKVEKEDICCPKSMMEVQKAEEEIKTPSIGCPDEVEVSREMHIAKPCEVDTTPELCEVSEGYDVTGFYLKYTRCSEEPTPDGNCCENEKTMAAAEQTPCGSFKITFKTDENCQQTCCEGNTDDFPEFQEKLSVISKAWIESARALCEELSKLREKSSATC